MHSYAQTNIQLFNQLRREGYSNTDLNLVRDGYELAMVLFTGRFQPSGKSFIAHVVGTASILASLRLPPKLVAAGLIHNVYENGDFGTGRSGISLGKRDEIRKTLGPEVEEYVASFAALCSTSPTADLARNNPDKLASVDRAALLILFAEGLEHLLDCDVLYYGETVTRSCIDHSKIAAEIAEKLGQSVLGAELREAIREVESAELPVEPSGQRAPHSFVIAPKSCCKRFSVALWQTMIYGAHKLHPEIQKVLRSLYVKCAKLLKSFSQPTQPSN
jgi:(p)ppGpp synthase/HD superfamily hydrolase